MFRDKRKGFFSDHLWKGNLQNKKLRSCIYHFLDKKGYSKIWWRLQEVCYGVLVNHTYWFDSSWMGVPLELQISLNSAFLAKRYRPSLIHNFVAESNWNQEREIRNNLKTRSLCPSCSISTRNLVSDCVGRNSNSGKMEFGKHHWKHRFTNH